MDTVDRLIIVAVRLTVAFEPGIGLADLAGNFWGSLLDEVDLIIVAEEDLGGGGA